MCTPLLAIEDEYDVVEVGINLLCHCVKLFVCALLLALLDELAA